MEFEATYNASRGVVQLAVERLKRDGFVDGRNRQGVFVVPHPPHLKRYGLVFPYSRSDRDWTRFDDALVREARRVEDAGEGHRFQVFAGVDDASGGAAIRQRLGDEVGVDRMAGLILVGAHDLADLPPFCSPALPKVFVFADESSPRRPIVTTDEQGWIDQALSWLGKDRGRKRVALVRLTSTFEYVTAADFERHGLTYHAKWRQTIGRGHPEVVSDLIPLLMDYPKDQRPDGLIIADDNLMDHASAALVKLGLPMGEDLDVVAHCNWPWPVPTAVPTQRLGFHAGEVLDRCIKAIDAQRVGEPFEAVQKVAAQWEHQAKSKSARGGPQEASDNLD